ncbi:hypothetical protein SEVIR_3G403666v4 [Setaria viridis]
MAEIPAAQCLYDEEEMLANLRDLVENDDNQGLSDDFRALRSKAALLEDAEYLNPESWDWVESAEPMALQAAEMLAREAADIQRALSLLSRRPGPEDEAFVAALRRQAVTTAAQRADAEGFAATTRRIREKELRRVAAAEHAVDPAMAAFLGYIAGETDASLARGEAPDADVLALAQQVEDDAVRMEESMAALAGGLRRGAAEFAARPGEEELVAALERQAATADAARATVVAAFTASVRRYRAAGSSLPPAAQPGHAERITIHSNISDLYKFASPLMKIPIFLQ